MVDIEKDLDIKADVSQVPVDSNGDRPSSVSLAVRVDKDGLPLVPQPTESPSDPLNYPTWLKTLILVEVSILAFCAIVQPAIINPAYVPLALDLGITVTQASQQATAALAMSAVSPFVWVPWSNVYGRRPVYLISALGMALFAFASGIAPSFNSLLAFRVLSGIFQGAPMALGASTVSDLFFLHERGVKMGVFTVFLNTGGHSAALVGGFIAQFTSWRWCYYVAALLAIVIFFVMLFTLPETIFDRPAEANAKTENDPVPQDSKQMWKGKLALWGHRIPSRSFQWIDTIRPLEMALYPAALFPSACYAMGFAFGSIEPGITIAFLFNEFYRFKPGRIGLLSGLTTLIGAITGEFIAGPIIDWLMRRARKRAGGKPVPESRLQGIWTGAIALPAGLLIYGFSIQRHESFVIACLGDSMAAFGVQIISTVCYAYISDCYKPQTGEISQLINFIRQMMGFTLGFYSIPFGQRVGFDFSFLTFVLIWIVLFFFPMIWLMVFGRAMRERQGVPGWNKGV